MNLFLAGYFGAGNFGDEAILAIFRKKITQFFPDARFWVMTVNPEQTFSLHGTETVSKSSLPALAAGIRRCDSVIFPGGSVFQDATSLRSLLYYGVIVEMAAAFGKPVHFFCQGLGPLARSVSKKLVKRWFLRAGSVSFRDPGSAGTFQSLLDGLVVDAPVRADAAMLAPEMYGFSVAKTKKDDGGLEVGVALKGGAYAADILGTVRKWAAERAVRGPVLNFVFHAGQDSDLSMEAPGAETDAVNVSWMERAGPFEAAAIPFVNRLSGLGLLVGMRLHALVFAAAMGTPFVALSYDPKVAEFARMTGQPCIEAERAAENPEELRKLLDEASGKRDELRGRLVSAGKDLKRQAALEFDRLIAKL